MHLFDVIARQSRRHCGGPDVGACTSRADACAMAVAQPPLPEESRCGACKGWHVVVRSSTWCAARPLTAARPLCQAPANYKQCHGFHWRHARIVLPGVGPTQPLGHGRSGGTIVLSPRQRLSGVRHLSRPRRPCATAPPVVVTAPNSGAQYLASLKHVSGGSIAQVEQTLRRG